MVSQRGLPDLKSDRSPGAQDAAAMRVIDPPIEEHPNLRQPMTRGEKAVFDLFNRLLPPEWEIYIQPHLNGLRPDFVLLNPGVGIAVFEVKDWNLDAMNYHVKEYPSGYQELCSTKDGQTFAVDNPFRKIKTYKDDIYNIYCPRLQQKSGYGSIVAGVIFPFASVDRVRKLQSSFINDRDRDKAAEYWPVAGQQEVRSGDLQTIMPLLGRKDYNLMRPALADDLRGWLSEPDFASLQRKPLEMDRNQRNLAQSRTTSGYRRIKGPAGSGKSLVLAARAASLINSGKNVLIVTFNVTLWHYLRDLVVRERKAVSNPGILTLKHFHSWCKDVCQSKEYAEEYARIVKPLYDISKLKLDRREEARRLRPILPEILNVKVPALAAKAAKSENAERYDAILVDEGQDYYPLWWEALRGALQHGGEMLLVADATQDVYGTAKSWTEEAMAGAGFPGGRWAKLDVSYRLPPDALPLVQAFANRFLPIETRDLPEPDQESLGLFPSNLRWIQCDNRDAEKQCVNAILAMMRQTGKAGLSNADITFITDNIDFGKGVVDDLETYRVRTANTFGRTKAEQDRQKMAFFLGDARVKATTFQSFKGWESRLLVIHIGNAQDTQSLAAVYAALTRLKRSPDGSHLTVVCTAGQLAEYGASWPRLG